jgi:ATP-dependent Lhr-like helicase
MAPITFFVREQALWMDLCLQQRQLEDALLHSCLSVLASRVRRVLMECGAMFAGDLIRALASPDAEVGRALWELVAAGLVTADGFDSLRVLVDPRRKSQFANPARAKSTTRPRNLAGRWCLLGTHHTQASTHESPGQAAERREAQIESACWMLLRRYGVIFRDVLERETNAPRWRDLLGMLRRLEARGEVRGGRFLSGFGGEQFALPDAVESLRAMRHAQDGEPAVTVAAADPLNLVSIVVPGERVAAVPGKTVTFRNGSALPFTEEVLQSDQKTIPDRLPNASLRLTQSGNEGLWNHLT